MSDIGFEALLAQHNEEFRNAEEFGNDWMPDIGKGYVVLLTKCKKDISTKDDKTYAWWRITGHIENVADVEQHGKDFCVGWFKTTVLVLGLAKGAARVLNNGVMVESLEEVDILFSDCPGKLVYVDIRESHSKKDGRDYINAYMTGLIATEEMPDEPVDPPQVDSPAEGQTIPV